MFRNNRNLLVIALIAVVNALGYGIIIPILYTYTERFGLNAFQYGLLFALFSLCQFLATPIIGRLSDKYGRKPLLLASIGGTAVSFFMLAFAPNAIVLFLARALDGLTAGNIPVAAAVISDTTEPKDRVRGFGIIGASFGFGLFVGPAISGLTVGISPAIPFIIAGIISVIAVLLTWFLLPETNKHIGEVKHDSLFNFSKLFHSLFDPNVGTTFLITLVYFISFGIFITSFQPFAQGVLSLNPQWISFIFSFFGLIGIISQVFFVQRLSRFFGLKKAFTISLGIVSIGFLLIGLSNNLYMFLIASVLMGFFNNSVQPLTQAILSEETDAKSQGSMQGLNASYMSIGMIIGPLLAGALATYSLAVPFFGSALCVLVGFILSFWIMRPGFKKESAF
jgi:MFS family permease